MELRTAAAEFSNRRFSSSFAPPATTHAVLYCLLQSVEVNEEMHGCLRNSALRIPFLALMDLKRVAMSQALWWLRMQLVEGVLTEEAWPPDFPANQIRKSLRVSVLQMVDLFNHHSNYINYQIPGLKVPLLKQVQQPPQIAANATLHPRQIEIRDVVCKLKPLYAGYVTVNDQVRELYAQFPVGYLLPGLCHALEFHSQLGWSIPFFVSCFISGFGFRIVIL